MASTVNPTERQERSFIDIINRAVAENGRYPITIVAGNTVLNSIQDARKYTARQLNGSEPYTDVIIFPKNSKQYNVSFKGRNALSLAGGGSRGIETIVPGLTGRFMKAAYAKLLSMGLKDGDKVPDVFAKLTDTNKVKLVIGTAGMGGPIDYMYIGSMEVRGQYDNDKNVVIFNGSLIPAKEYAKSTELYLRLRARREDQRFDSVSQIGGIPKIYGRSPSRGDVSGRIVVTDQPAGNGVYVEI